MQTTSNTIKPLRVALVGGLTLGAAALLATWLWHIVAATAQPLAVGAQPDAGELVTAVAAASALAGLGWLLLGMVLELVALVPGTVGRVARAVGETLTPRLVRRSVSALLGLGVVAGLAPGASVASPPRTVSVAAPLPDPGFRPPPDPGWSVSADAVARPATSTAPAPGAAPTTGWVPQAPPVRPQPDVGVLGRAPRGPGPEPSEVVVHRGDSLWSIAARHLGPGTTDAEVAEAWPAWFDANRDVIGNDPDLLLPGQVLRVPDRASAS